MSGLRQLRSGQPPVESSLGDVVSQSEERARKREPAVREGKLYCCGTTVSFKRSAAVKSLILVMPVVLFLCFTSIHAQAGKDNGPDKPSETSRVRIEVTGGDEKKPVADASVYLKFAEERKVLKDRHIEFNLKTNQEGIAHSPEVPKGKILIQIVAPGWKPFGEYYQLTENEQTIQIHLLRPSTKWY
jgi:hypothetical protein